MSAGNSPFAQENEQERGLGLVRRAEERQATPKWRHGWPVPTSIDSNPDRARAWIHLPAFAEETLERARVYAGRVPLAEAEYRALRRKPGEQAELPHFERVFRIAAAMGGAPGIAEEADYDELLILTAWQAVRPGEEGFLGSYPKWLLCPLSHTAPPVALERLTPGQRIVFERRAPYYLRYLICERFGLRTCLDLENADLRQLLRNAGFRIIRASAAPEVAFAGSTRGEDPPVRPWKLTLRQELTEEAAAELLTQAALWQMQYGLRLARIERGQVVWNIGAFERTDWEEAFLSLGVRVPGCFTRESGRLDWRALLGHCLVRIGTGNLPSEVLGKVTAGPQRVSHDDRKGIWEVLDRAARSVLEQARVSDRELFTETGELRHEAGRSFRRWARLFDEVSPNILSRFGVSAFTALHRVAPEYFGWGRTQLKPWELEQEHGKWKGPRGRALLRSAYAFALHEAGLGRIEAQEEQVLWVCTTSEFAAWAAAHAQRGESAYEFLYGLASRHGLTPLLNREITHTMAVSLLAGVNVHTNLPRIEGSWEVCVQAALEHHGGKLEVRLVLPDLAPLPLRLRKAALAPLAYSYLHQELRLVRDFDLRMARESRRKLEEIPGWWEDDRICGTPLLGLVENREERARQVLEVLEPEPWLQPKRVRFGALQLLLSKRATKRTAPGEAGLSSEEVRVLMRMALDGALEYSNIAQVSFVAIRRGFQRVLAREDTREMLDSLLLHVGTAYETTAWGQVRKRVVLDLINDLVGLAIRCALLHLMAQEEK